MFFGKQLFDEMLHVETYLLLVDNYLPDPAERSAAFEAYKNIPSIKLKADFCFKYMDSIYRLDSIRCFLFSPHTFHQGHKPEKSPHFLLYLPEAKVYIPCQFNTLTA